MKCNIYGVLKYNGKPNEFVVWKVSGLPHVLSATIYEDCSEHFGIINPAVLVENEEPLTIDIPPNEIHKMKDISNLTFTKRPNTDSGTPIVTKFTTPLDWFKSLFS